MKNLITALKMFFLMTVITGIAYPLLTTAIANLTMKQKASGSLIVQEGKLIGSQLIAQKFESPRYFWPRPSAVNYNPLPSGGSNLGPTSKELKKAVELRRSIIAKTQNGLTIEQIPSELLFASGSGLDPHISPATAIFQIDRIVQARGWSEPSSKIAIEKLIEDLTEGRFLGFIGEPCVNVLQLNLALDNLEE